jgi:hypothetical protein
MDTLKQFLDKYPILYCMSFLAGILIFVVVFLGLMALGIEEGLACAIAGGVGLVSLIPISHLVVTKILPRF